MIDITVLKTLLKFEGIDLSEYTDEELNILIDSKVSELEGLLGFNIKPAHQLQTTTGFQGDVLRLDFYPVADFNSIYLNDECLKPCQYKLNPQLGIVYFDTILRGDIKVKYISGQSDEFISSVVAPIIKDMIGYTLTYNNLGVGGPVSSIHEGNVSISYDTNNSYGKRISDAVADAKLKYGSARLRWL